MVYIFQFFFFFCGEGNLQLLLKLSVHAFDKFAYVYGGMQMIHMYANSNRIR